jgi:hypothetical protein
MAITTIITVGLKITSSYESNFISFRRAFSLASLGGLSGLRRVIVKDGMYWSQSGGDDAVLQGLQELRECFRKASVEMEFIDVRLRRGNTFMLADLPGPNDASAR